MTQAQNNSKGILFILIGMALFSIQDALIKFIYEEVALYELYEEYIRSKAETAYHPSCTLKMGIDDMAVVDEKLKVHGMKNLRVVDASVMPEITSGNLNAPTLMIAERASEFILNSWHKLKIIPEVFFIF